MGNVNTDWERLEQSVASPINKNQVVMSETEQRAMPHATPVAGVVLGSDIGQVGEVEIPDLHSVIGNLRDIRDFMQIVAESVSPGNLFSIDAQVGTADANGNIRVDFPQTPIGFVDRLSRLVIQNPTGTGAFVCRNLTLGFPLAGFGVSLIPQIIDYVSSANPASIIDQTEEPPFMGGDSLTVIMQGATVNVGQGFARATFRRSRR